MTVSPRVSRDLPPQPRKPQQGYINVDEPIPANEVRFAKKPDHPMNGLASLESLCSVISAITLPESLDCQQKEAHVRFDHFPGSEDMGVDALPRFPTRQGSDITVLAALAAQVTTAPRRSKSCCDICPRKPERKTAKSCMGKVMRRAMSMVSKADSCPSFPTRQHSSASRTLR
ncbi:expressed unknown protein [Seminavis robusta]|uniref:Uncharacterized protein n=1 Tax=Seminavis robusta TaxID=568900 RepID=A0A9N8EXU6_9STRA|nr:expressed unknown protein [Seminavis robusta]|eukprot:Sro2029_g311761.1  (173) ;mRNA; r:5298-5816